jgi:hypothetical protein
VFQIAQNPFAAFLHLQAARPFLPDHLRLFSRFFMDDRFNPDVYGNQDGLLLSSDTCILALLFPFANEGGEEKTPPRGGKDCLRNRHLKR